LIEDVIIALVIRLKDNPKHKTHSTILTLSTNILTVIKHDDKKLTFGAGCFIDILI